MSRNYEKLGYEIHRQYFDDAFLQDISPIIRNFHHNWIYANREFYNSKAVNSAYLTGNKHLSEKERGKLFQLLGSNKISNILSSLPFEAPTFLNTQLFFNPTNSQQRNYWHRDSQYHLSIEEQKLALKTQKVIHFRIALEDEPGLELVPSSHRKWDSKEELDVRLETSRRQNFEDLSTGLSIPLQKGDLLIFSANMIHRGLYGKNRFSFDILFCEFQPLFATYIEQDCLPSSTTLLSLENPSIFQNALNLKSDI